MVARSLTPLVAFWVFALPVLAGPDVVVVGAGIGGLSTALEAANNGLSVTVMDMASVFGGHALMSTGGLSIVDTPLQRERGIKDSPDLAYQDFLNLGEDANPAMVRLYADHSREMIYDWLTGMGVKFTGVSTGGSGNTGNSAPRFHVNPQLGYGLVAPLYRECLKSGKVQFVWNTQAVEVLKHGDKVTGVRGRNLRTGKMLTVQAPAVVLATGGFESNRELVRKNWPSFLGKPEYFVTGSGIHSQGTGLEMAKAAGGDLENMDHQWIYPRGLPDPRHLKEGRGIYFSVFDSIFVNKQGKRFMDETAATKETIRAVMAQDPPTYWAIFDEPASHRVGISGADWRDDSVKRKLVIENPEVVKSAPTLDELAKAAGLPADVLKASVARWNEMVEKKEDTDFGRSLKPLRPMRAGRPAWPGPAKIAEPPFYAAQMYPMSRKSMGGVKVDTNGRVLNAGGQPVPGLFAVGEVSGLGGINGKAGLEGTFLGPSLFQGRMAARYIAAASKREPLPETAAKPAPAGSTEAKPVNVACRSCHPIEKQIATHREGYWHYEKVHSLVMERKLECAACHSEMGPYRPGEHKIDRLAQVNVCLHCHLTASE